MEIEMDPSTAQFHHQHHQEMSSQSQTLESMLVCNKAAQEKKPRPPDQAALKCPRCDSTNTKFCYYNNYSLTQPRYFCKSCRRYWTKGGTLRNVPVGGGCRKSNKRPSSSSSNSTSPTSSSSSKRAHDLHHHQPLLITSSNPNPLLTQYLHPSYHHDSTTTDLSLAFARLQSQANAGFDHDFLANSQNTPHDHFLATTNTTGNHHHSFLDAIRGGFLESGNSSTGGFHNVYPFGDHLGNAENNGGILGLNNVSHEDQMGMNHHHHHHHQEDHMAATSGAATTAVTVTTVKQESCNARDAGESSRVLWGFPWQIGGDQGNVVEVDSGRQIGNWTGFGSTWHGLLNSPLM